MLVRLKNDASPAEREALLRVAHELGMEPRFLGGGHELLELTRREDSAAGPADPACRTRLEDLSFVQAVLDASDAPELNERRAGQETSRVTARRAEFGCDSGAIIAGPCAVEDVETLLEIARAVEGAGATALRGGAFKPRTSPYSFQGLGDRGLEMLAEAREQTGLAIVTEVLDPRDVPRVAEVADILQIGTRNMTNFALLTEVGRGSTPVLLKRGMAATIREFLLAAEYVLAGGNENVILCERGIRGLTDVTRNLLDVGAVAYLKQATHLPVIVDPSHAAGRSDLVPALARAGIAVGADGLIVEVHPQPREARSDGAQALSLSAFERVVDETERILALDGRRLSKPAALESTELPTSGAAGDVPTIEPLTPIAKS